MLSNETIGKFSTAATKILKANAKALKIAQDEVYEHLFGEGGGVDPTPYLPAWETDRITMTELTIPEGVTKIGGYSFDMCFALTSLTIPEGVTSIGEYAFSDCEALTSLTIPNSVTSIGDGAFSNCQNLNPLTILEGVTSIGPGAFSICSALTSLTIPNSVTSIGGNAFAHCSALASLTIPNSVTSIGYKAFDYCPKTCDIHFDKPSAEVSAMSYYPWGITSGAVIHCSDGVDLTVE